MLQALQRRLVSIQDKLRNVPEFRWAMVVTTSPLTIIFDAAASPMAGTPSTLVDGLRAGDRVQVMLQHRRATIIGRGGGDRPKREPIVRSVGESNYNINSDTWQEVPPTLRQSLYITCVEPEWWTFTFGAWWSPGNAESRAGILLTGATDSDWNKPSWGAVARREPTYQSGTMYAHKTVKLNPGSTRVRTVAGEPGGGTFYMSYGMLTCVPV